MSRLKQDMKATLEKLFSFLIIFSSLLMMLACQEEMRPEGELRCPVEALSGTRDDVAGKWKLVRGEILPSTSPEVISEDYSCDNIIFHFGEDGSLVITSDVEDYIGIIPEEYRYELGEQTYIQDEEPLHILILADQSYFGTFSESEMKIWVNPIDYRALYHSEIISYLARIP